MKPESERSLDVPLPRGVRAALLLLAGLTLGGCVSPSYYSARKRDAADIVTMTVGVGLGAQARVGPVHLTPMLYAADMAGLRGGEWFHIPDFGVDLMHPPLDIGAVWWASSIWDVPSTDRMRQRGKAHLATPLMLPADTGIYDAMSNTPPFIMVPRLAWKREEARLPRYPWAFHTQLELTLALGYSLRLGFNPGEVLDFAVGWFGLDLLRDDRPGVSPLADSNEPSRDSERPGR